MEFWMKSSKMLFLSMIAVFSMVSGLNTKSIDYTPYVTGNGLDKDGRNVFHFLASNCDASDFVEQLKEFERVALESSDFSQTTPSVIAIDKNGDTPLLLAFKKTVSSGSDKCILMTHWFLALETAERNRNK